MPQSNYLSTESELAPIEAEYRAFRAAIDRLSQQVGDKLDPWAVDLTVKRLGMFDRKKVVANSETQMAVLIDYAMYEVRSGGMNAVERFMEESPPPRDSREFHVLEAMCESICTVILLEERESGLGFYVRDMLTDERYLLADLHLAGSGEPGVMLLTRLFFHDDFCCTSGAALPLGKLTLSPTDATLRDFLRMFGSFAPADRDFAPLIAKVLKAGGDLQMRTRNIEDFGTGTEDPEIYEPESPYAGPEKLEPYRAPAAPIGRNERCPCGSGKKFKQCCLRKAK